MKLIPWCVLVWRDLLLFYHISVLVWRYRIGSRYPLQNAPDWAVHYMARFLYNDELNDVDEDYLDDLVSIAQEEWQLRKFKRNKNRRI